MKGTSVLRAALLAACKAGDPASIPGLGRSPGEGNGNPLQYSSLGNPMDFLAGYSPWGCKESDRTETHTHTHTPTHTHTHTYTHTHTVFVWRHGLCVCLQAAKQGTHPCSVAHCTIKPEFIHWQHLSKSKVAISLFLHESPTSISFPCIPFAMLLCTNWSAI